MQNNIKPSLEEIEKAIIQRDRIDFGIDKENRASLVGKGLKLIRPKKVIKIDTGEVIGVSNVIDLIKKEITSADKIISIEGESGCGKSSTAEMLAEEIDAILFSMGEVFRYLTYVRLVDNDFEIKEELNSLEYRIVEDKLCLYKQSQNISNELKSKLNSHRIDLEVAKTAKESQREVIEFMSKSIPIIAKDSGKTVVLEGRSFTLDFLPCDLRVILYTDIKVRAERRMNQTR